MTDLSPAPAFFKANRRKLAGSLPGQVIVVSAAGLVQKTADESLPFRQDSNFWYLSGLNEPDLILVIDSSEEYIIVPDFYSKRQSWTQSLDLETLKRVSGITQVLNEKEGWQKLDDAVAKKSKIATALPPPSLIRRYGIYANPARRHLVASLRRRYKATPLTDIRLKLAAQRMVKQPIEIKLIQEAINITTATLSDVLSGNLTTRYINTGQIEQAIAAGFLKRGGSGHAFEPIVASGKNAATIHFAKLGLPLKARELIVVDVGAKYSFYGADISRTLSYGPPTSRQQAVFEAVRHVQSEAYKLIKPGIKMRDYERQVERLIGLELKQLGLIDRLSRQAIRQYYPHASSHSLGIDTHDSADYNLPLPENMVMTVEPGIYIPEEGIGVRIEDVVRVTKDGYQLLSSGLPTSLKL